MGRFSLRPGVGPIAFISFQIDTGFTQGDVLIRFEDNPTIDPPIQNFFTDSAATADYIPIQVDGYVNVRSVGVADEIDSPAATPHSFTLMQNCPNPFNPITEIKYTLPKDCQVRLEIYNTLGQKVASLVDGKQKVGYKTVRWDASQFASGLYFCRISAGDFVETRRMILLR